MRIYVFMTLLLAALAAGGGKAHAQFWKKKSTSDKMEEARKAQEPVRGQTSKAEGKSAGRGQAGKQGQTGGSGQGQTQTRELPQSGQARSGYMHYTVDEKGDTVYIAELRPVWVFPKGARKGTEWRKYYRLVYNFNKVYPYALMAKKLVSNVDMNIEDMNRVGKEKYINIKQRELLKEFEPVVRKMTISQGQLLCRLLDREIGMSSYEIIKDYKNGMAAGFWQGVGKIFDQDLKSRYDPQGIDRQTEELVMMWENGEFDRLYFSIFWEDPKKPAIPAKYR